MTDLTREAITELLLTNDKAVIRALEVLNSRQTFDEQNSEVTKHDNGRGFRPCDARKGTNMVKWYQKTGFMTPKMIAYWRKPNAKGVPRIAVYTRQLIEEAKAKAEKNAA